MSIILEMLGIGVVVTLSVILINGIIEYIVWIRPLRKVAIRLEMFRENNLFSKLLVEDRLKETKRRRR